MKKILVTGASGFMGTEVCNTLRARGIPFVAAVRKGDHDGQCEVGDITSSTKWDNALFGCDVIIHLAARVHVMNENTCASLDAYRTINVDGTLNLAKQAVAHGIKRFVFVSSVKVNGDRTIDKPFSALDLPAPIDSYGRSKLEAECALRKLSKETGLELVVVRPPLIYGPGVRANFFKLMKLVRLGLPLPFGSVRNRRSLAALNNVVDLLILCAHHPDAIGKTFMVSDDEDLSLSGLITLIAQSMDKHPIMVPVPANLMMSCANLLGKAENASRLLDSLQVDISDTKECLGWRPVETVEEAVEKTVSHFLAQ